MKDRGESELELPVRGIISRRDVTNPKTAEEYEDMANATIAKMNKRINSAIGKRLKQDIYDSEGNLIAAKDTIVDNDLAITLVKNHIDNRKYLRSSLFANGAIIMAKIVKCGAKVATFAFAGLSCLGVFAVPAITVSAITALGVFAAGYAVVASIIAKTSRTFIDGFRRFNKSFKSNINKATLA